MRSEIYGGLANEINTLLEETTLRQDLERILFCFTLDVIVSQNFFFQVIVTWMLWKLIRMLPLALATVHTTGQKSLSSLVSTLPLQFPMMVVNCRY